MQSGGLLLLFNIHHCYVRYGMTLKLNDSETVFNKMILTAGEYRESRIRANEILVDGRMYDVKKAVVKGSMVELHVINDYEEENIIEKILEAAKSSGLGGKNIPNHLLKLVTLVYIPPSDEFTFYVPSFPANRNNNYVPGINSLYMRVSLPPPEA